MKRHKQARGSARATKSATTYEAQLMTAARAVGRLERRCRELRKQLKTAAAELRHERKMLKALASAKTDPFEQTPPMRVFGESAK